MSDYLDWLQASPELSSFDTVSLRRPVPCLDRVLIHRRTRIDAQGCWVWMGSRNVAGYGRIVHRRKHYAAHRLSYNIFVGPIPDGLHIDHLCKNKSCVNPSHLEAVTPRVNTLRSDCAAAVNARKTHCKRGHELTPDNIVRTRVGRNCLKCSREYHRTRHCRLRCEQSLPYDSKAEANAHRIHHRGVRAYKCRHCERWHLSQLQVQS